MWLSGSRLGKLPSDSGGHEKGDHDQDDDNDDGHHVGDCAASST